MGPANSQANKLANGNGTLIEHNFHDACNAQAMELVRNKLCDALKENWKENGGNDNNMTPSEMVDGNGGNDDQVRGDNRRRREIMKELHNKRKSNQEYNVMMQSKVKTGHVDMFSEFEWKYGPEWTEDSFPKFNGN